MTKPAKRRWRTGRKPVISEPAIRHAVMMAERAGARERRSTLASGARRGRLSTGLGAARHRAVRQCRPHSKRSALRGIRHLVIAVNKMDLVDWKEERFLELRDQ